MTKYSVYCTGNVTGIGLGFSQFGYLLMKPQRLICSSRCLRRMCTWTAVAPRLRSRQSEIYGSDNRLSLATRRGRRHRRAEKWPTTVRCRHLTILFGWWAKYSSTMFPLFLKDSAIDWYETLSDRVKDSWKALKDVKLREITAGHFLCWWDIVYSHAAPRRKSARLRGANAEAGE